MFETVFLTTHPWFLNEAIKTAGGSFFFIILLALAFDFGSGERGQGGGGVVRVRALGRF